MIKEWGVANFKSIREKADLKLKPLTILAGSNSSGKSTFIQSILLVSQTLLHKIGNRPVILNGALTDLGQFDDLKSSGSGSNRISVSFSCEPIFEQADGKLKKLAITSKGNAIYYGSRSTGFHSVSCEFSFDSTPRKTGNGNDGQRQSQPRLRLLSSKLVCTPNSNPEKKSEIVICHRGDSGHIGQNQDETDDDAQLNEGFSYEVELDERSNIEIKSEYMSAHPRGCVMKHFLPRRIIYEINETLETANTISHALQYGLPQVPEFRAGVLAEPVITEGMLCELQQILKDIVNVEELFARGSGPANSVKKNKTISLRAWYESLLSRSPEERIKIQQVLRECDELFGRIYDSLKKSDQKVKTVYIQDRPPERITVASWYLDDFFSTSLRYLAPLRDSPKSLYPSGNMFDPTDIGIRGENTASILEMYKNHQIKYIPSSAFADPQMEKTLVKSTLGEAIVDWIRYLGLATEVQSLDLGKVGHSLQVRLDDGEQAYDLTHVGVGVSQVLPILVLSLLSERDATLVLEQPELHLHPKTQTLLGDFFLSLALSDKQCIVETHSEYIVDRIRYQIAASKSENGLGGITSLYFVEKSEQGSSFREIKINEYGAIVDWPEGFFDQSYQQATDILRAASNKRMSEKENDE